MRGGAYWENNQEGEFWPSGSTTKGTMMDENVESLQPEFHLKFHAAWHQSGCLWCPRWAEIMTQDGNGLFIEWDILRMVENWDLGVGWVDGFGVKIGSGRALGSGIFS